MSDKKTLLPCPWCGVDMQLHAINYRWLDGKPGWYLWHENVGEAVRRKCPMEMGHYDTREEAIAACNTRAELGSEPPYDELLRCLENDWHISASWDGLRKFWCIELTEEGVKLRDVAHGTLTAEQVRETVLKRGNVMGPRFYGDWQAITDELNAKLGSGTCEVECFDDGVDEGMDGEWFSYAPPTWYLSCGHTAQGAEKPNFCPNCGARIRKAVTR